VPAPTTTKSGHLAPPYRSPALTAIERVQDSLTSTPPKSQQSLSPSGFLTQVLEVSAKPLADEGVKLTSGSLQPRFFLKESPEYGDSSPDRESRLRDIDTSITAGDASSHGDSSIMGKSGSSGKAPSSLDSQKISSMESKTVALSKKGTGTAGVGASTGAAPRRKPVHQVVARPTRPANHRMNSRLGQKKSKSSTNVPNAVVPAATNLIMTRTVSAQGESRTSAVTSAEKHRELLSQKQLSGPPSALSESPSHAPTSSRTTVHRKATDRSTSRARAGPHQQRRGIVMDTSSTEYETTDSEDDSEWASEDISLAEDRAHRRRAKNRQDEEKARRMRDAEEEDRQRRDKDMFMKLPRTSYTQLPDRMSGLSSGPGPRTRSVGLLSQLLNPDPVIFPQNHPYRTSFSTQDMTQFSRVSGLSMGRSSAAAPLASQTNALALSKNGDAHGSGGGKYRPRGRPEGAEMDDDSGEEDENKLELSASLAEQRLAALMGPHRRRRRLQEEEKLDQRQLPPGGPREHHAVAQRVHILAAASTAPIPLTHPYNLPAPAPPSTPRTTRRQMLATELSESLRRNLLWERQISKIGGGGAPRRRSTLLGNDGLRPLTSMATSSNGGNSNQSDGRGGTRSGDETINGRERDPKEERRRRALAKNKSWADDYHYSGW
jgi:Protein of unknown function (DUF3295)